MRRLIQLLAFACSAWAQTEIKDTIYTPFSGQLFEGNILISGPAMKTQDGRTVARWTKQIAISNGALNVGLEPNDTAMPQGTSYTVIYRPKSGFGWTEYWIVPTSATPLRISDVRVAQPPVPEMMIQPSQISDGGARDEQVLSWDASVRRWVPQRVTIDAAQIASGTLPLARGGTNQTSWTPGRCVQVSADGTQLESASGACGAGGGGGGVGGSGTAGTVPLWADSTTLGDSSIVETQDAINAGKKLIVAGPIESQSTEPGAAVLYSSSGGSVALQAPDTATDWTVTAPAANGTLALEGHEHDASAIVSGTLPVARGGTGNGSYSPSRCIQSSSDGQSLVAMSGACSLEGHAHTLSGDASGGTSSLTVVGLQGRSVSSATPSDGQALVWDGSGQQWKPATISGGPGGWDPMDTTTLVLRDDFCSGGTSAGQIGALGWATSTIQGTAISTSYNIGSSLHPCEVRGIGVSSTNANDGKSLYLLLSATAPFHNAASAGNWEAVFIWQYPSYATELRSRVGLVKFDQPNVLVPDAFMGLRIDTDSAWEPSGTTFIACICNGNAKSNCTDIDTGITVAADTWYKLRIWSDAAGLIKMSINNGSTITFDNPSTLPGGTVDFQPAWIVGRSGGSGSRQASVDFFAGRVTGINR